MLLNVVPVGVKFCFLFVVAFLVYRFEFLWFHISLLFLGLLGLFFLVEGFGGLWRFLRGFLVVCVFVFLGGVVGGSLYFAVLGVLRLLVLYVFASVVSLSTGFVVMLNFFERFLGFLKFFGVDVGKISLVFTLVLRFIPVFRVKYLEVFEAQRARGLQGKPLALFLPLLVRVLWFAREVSDSLFARGYGDDGFGKE